MKLEYLEAGEIVTTHGVRGEMRVNPWCDTPSFLKKFKKLYLDEKGEKSLDIKSAREHGNVALIVAEGIDTVEKADFQYVFYPIRSLNAEYADLEGFRWGG